jgi:hypothetical protein
MTDSHNLVERLEALGRPLEAAPEPDFTEVRRRARRPDHSRPVALRSRGVRFMAVALAVSGIAAAVLFFPFSHSRANVLDQALAAITEQGPVLHAVITAPLSTIGGGQEPVTVVDLKSGQASPLINTIEIYWNQDTGETSESVDGQRIGRRMSRPGSAFAAFFSGYRAALAAGTATVASSGAIDGRDVVWLRFPPADSASSAEEVAIDAQTYDVIALRSACTVCTAPARLYRVVTLEGVSAMPTVAFASPPATGDQPEPAYSIGRLDDVASFVSHPVWAGASIDGLALSGIEIARLSISDHTAGAGAEKHGITLYYGTNGPPKFGLDGNRPYVVVAETRDVGFRFHAFNMNQVANSGVPVAQWSGPLPPDGKMILGGGSPVWIGQMQQNDLYIEIEGSSRDLIVNAATALTLIG